MTVGVGALNKRYARSIILFEREPVTANVRAEYPRLQSQRRKRLDTIRRVIAWAVDLRRYWKQRDALVESAEHLDLAEIEPR